jgi:hypothetical protein
VSAFVTIFSLILGIIFFFIDGMLIYSIEFFLLFVILGLMKVMWGIAVVDSVIRRVGEDGE